MLQVARCTNQEIHKALPAPLFCMRVEYDPWIIDSEIALSFTWLLVATGELGL
jgi:hypothetical protein